MVAISGIPFLLRAKAIRCAPIHTSVLYTCTTRMTQHIFTAIRICMYVCMYVYMYLVLFVCLFVFRSEKTDKLTHKLSVVSSSVFL